MALARAARFRDPNFRPSVPEDMRAIFGAARDEVTAAFRHQDIRDKFQRLVAVSDTEQVHALAARSSSVIDDLTTLNNGTVDIDAERLGRALSAVKLAIGRRAGRHPEAIARAYLALSPWLGADDIPADALFWRGLEWMQAPRDATWIDNISGRLVDDVDGPALRLPVPFWRRFVERMSGSWLWNRAEGRDLACQLANRAGGQLDLRIPLPTTGSFLHHVESDRYLALRRHYRNGLPLYPPALGNRHFALSATPDRDDPRYTHVRLRPDATDAPFAASYYRALHAGILAVLDAEPWTRAKEVTDTAWVAAIRDRFGSRAVFAHQVYIGLPELPDTTLGIPISLAHRMEQELRARGLELPKQMRPLESHVPKITWKSRGFSGQWPVAWSNIMATLRREISPEFPVLDLARRLILFHQVTGDDAATILPTADDHEIRIAVADQRYQVTQLRQGDKGFTQLRFPVADPDTDAAQSLIFLYNTLGELGTLGLFTADPTPELLGMEWTMSGMATIPREPTDLTGSNGYWVRRIWAAIDGAPWYSRLLTRGANWFMNSRSDKPHE